MTETRQLIGDRFQVGDMERDLLGRGGMGEVYRGVDLQTGEPVAIKALRPDVVAGDPDVVARFLREGEALRTLNHPNIVQMVAAVEEEGTAFGKAAHYLVMEYVPGGSLRDLLEQERRLSVERTVEIALEVADALTRAHHLGILHRDLKPSNVLLAEDGTPRLTDFGHARLATGPRLTRTGTVVGTVHYLSPEACEGQEQDTRSDTWSFGVMLYEMLTGQPPFDGDTLTAVLAAILTRPVPDLHDLRPEVPDALVDLVYRMLEKDRVARIPSVRLVGAELEAISQGYGLPGLTVGQLGLRVEGWRVERGKQQLPPVVESRFATPTPTAEAPAADEGRPPHNLPVQLTPFVGREAELAELDRLLSDPDVRLVTVLGAGGMGKTRLALEAAERQLDRFPHGVYFASLAALQSADAIVPTIAEALGFSFYSAASSGAAGGGTAGAPRRQLLDYLRQKQMLLVLDNVEHLLAEHSPSSTEEGRGHVVDIATDLLKNAPSVKLLATSRARLNVGGEVLFHLTGMDVPQPMMQTPAEAVEDAADLTGRSEYSAVELFVQSARRVRLDFEPEAKDLEDIACVCRLVQGMPLAILLAAAWIEMLTPAEIARELAPEVRQSLDFLETDAHDVPERQRSIRGVFDYSWRLLTERQRAVAQALSVFRGGFTRQAAQAVSDASLRDLMHLVNRSLLYRTPKGRYEMHEMLRQYAEHKLEDSGMADAVRDRHSVYYCGFLHQRESDLKGIRQLPATEEIETEIENTRGAWDWACTRGDGECIDRAVESLGLFYRWRGRYQEGEVACRSAADTLAGKLHADMDGTVRRVLAKVLAWQGAFSRELGRAGLAGQLFERGLRLLQHDALASRDARPAEALLLYERGRMVSDADYARAEALFQRSLALYRALNDRWGAARALRRLGDMAWRVGAHDEARRLFQESLDISRSLGTPRDIADSLANLANNAIGQGRFDEAERQAREGFSIREEIGDRVAIATGSASLSLALHYQGRFTESIEMDEQTIALFSDLGHRYGLAFGRTQLGRDMCHLGRYGQARAQGRDSLVMYREMGHRFFITGSLSLLGQVGLATEDYAEAQQCLQEDIAISRALSQWNQVSMALTHLSYVAHAQGNIPQARSYILQALRTNAQVGAFLPNMLAIPGAALVLAAQGQIERAAELYALASRYPYVANSRWFEDVAGRHIAAVATALPPETVATARERGRARDLSATVEELLAEFGE